MSIWTPALQLERILMHGQMAKLILIWLDWHCRHTHEYNGVHTLKPTGARQLHLDYELENDTKSSTKTMGQDGIHSFILKKWGKRERGKE